jgi:hypothetical protein
LVFDLYKRLVADAVSVAGDRVSCCKHQLDLGCFVRGL